MYGGCKYRVSLLFLEYNRLKYHIGAVISPIEEGLKGVIINMTYSKTSDNYGTYFSISDLIFFMLYYFYKNGYHTKIIRFWCRMYEAII